MTLLYLIEIIGTIAFAISGALIGMNKKLDVFGVSFLAVLTATGGGIFRDIFIGNIPPNSFKNPIYCTLSILTGLIIFFAYPKFNKIINNDMNKFKRVFSRILTSKNIINVTDAMGLAVFTALGANTAMINFGNNPFIVVCMALFTGVGGGIIRDVSVQDIPLVFTKEIYAVATIFGGLIYYFVHIFAENIVALYVCFIFTFVLRVISVKLNLHLPKPRVDV